MWQHAYLDEGEVQSAPRILISIEQQLFFHFHALQEHVLRWIKPSTTSLVLGTLTDLSRGKAELLAENTLLRQQLIILRRQVTRPVYRKTDRFLLVLLARMVRTWKQALFIIQPETLLCWHRELFRVFWKHTSKACARKPRLSPETIALIKEWRHTIGFGERSVSVGNSSNWIFGEVKRTIQKYMKQLRPKQARGQNWKTFFHNHAREMWACDFLQATSLFFRSLFAFFVIEVKSRKVIHVNVTRSPTDPWVAQQLREATPYGHTPTYVIRDNDRKFGPNFARVATTSGIKVLRTPYRTRAGRMPSVNGFWGA